MKTSVNFSFLGSDAALDSAKFVVLPVPYDATQTFRTGARFGPLAIIAASMHTDMDDEQPVSQIADSVYTTPELEISKAAPEKTLENVEEAVSEILGWKKTPVVLGGDHSITIGAVKAASKHYKGLSVLQIDAHADLFDEYEGTRHSHACTMRRCRELCNCVQFGMRMASPEEKGFIDAEKPKGIFMGCELGKERIAEITSALTDDVYITFDLDAFNPLLVPEVGNPVPGGLAWEQAVELLQAVFAKRNIVGFDVVELTPVYMNSNSAVVAAKLAAKMMAMKGASI